MSSHEAYARLVQALRCGQNGCSCANARPDRPTASLHCPVHEDTRPSLSVSLAPGGRLLWHCHAGCAQADVMRALQDLGLLDRADATTAAPVLPIASTTRYEIRNTAGVVQAVHVRYDLPDDSKRFAWEQPNGTPGLGGRAVSSLPLFGEHLLKDHPGEPVVVVEGEKSAQILLNAGRLAVGTVTGAHTSPSTEALQPLAGHDVFVWADADEPGRQHMRRIAGTLEALGIEVRSITWPDAPDGGDAADFVGAYAAGEALERLLAGAQSMRNEPLAVLLDRVEAFLRRFVVFANPHQVTACALWVAHTYVYDSFDVSPFLHVTSPEKRSGKTRLLEVLELTVRSPWRVVSPSEAVLYRKVDGDHPTLLLDEVDTIFGRESAGRWRSTPSRSRRVRRAGACFRPRSRAAMQTTPGPR